MSREIKFQCIYRPTGEKFEPVKVDFLNQAVHGSFDNEAYDHCHYSTDPNGYGDAWLREYTGLKDKNGVEIYEGDVVQFLKWKPKEVVFQDKAFAGFTLKGTNLFLTTYDAEEMVVIGNRFEHPHLLEVSDS